MTAELKEFIENNIEYLDKKDYYFFLLNAFGELTSNAEMDALIDILYKVDDDQASIDKARENVLRFYITMQIEEYADDDSAPNSYSIMKFIMLYIGFYVRYTAEEIMDFILENQSEWADNMIEKNGQWRICK